MADDFDRLPTREQARTDRGRLNASMLAADIKPLVGVIGAISAIFATGMLADKIGPLLKTKPIIQMASTHATALFLIPAATIVSLAIVAFLRLIVGPFTIGGSTKERSVQVSGGAVATVVWMLCLGMELLALKIFW